VWNPSPARILGLPDAFATPEHRRSQSQVPSSSISGGVNPRPHPEHAARSIAVK
jgi:hypothetical protein